MSKVISGVLALEDGSVYRGSAFGGTGTVVGESVFNTSMTGYQEILTDPSYFAQIVTMTAPHIGNYGINPEDAESDSPKVSGFVVHELSAISSNWRSRQDLADYLAEYGIPCLSGVDTRAITKRIRVTGALKACLSTNGLSDAEALQRAREWPGLLGVDYVKEVTTREPYTWKVKPEESTPFTVEGIHLNAPAKERKKYRVAAFDFGAKYNIFRKLSYHGFDIEVVPAHTTAKQIRAMKPDCVFLSNGPGDPGAVGYAHDAIAELIELYPVFGICLGHQVITHALGAGTFKLKFGHRGANQPVKNLETGQVSITAQNHGFAASAEELEKCGAIITEINLNDGTVEGLRHRELPVFSVQYHPEASPGPHDSDPLFDQFYKMVADSRG